MTTNGNEILCATIDETSIVLIRVRGRGTAQNAPAVKQLAAHLESKGRHYRFVFDFEECDALDSTFLGTIASLALAQKTHGMGDTILLNASANTLRVLKTMGLGSVCDLRPEGCATPFGIEKAANDLQPVEATETSRLDQICLCLQAHQNLADLDAENKVRFESVIEYLKGSLEKEKQKQA